MGMCPALPIAMLACARIGAPHTIIFGGFSCKRPGGPHHGFAGVAGDHAGWLLPARRRGEIEAGRRRSAALLSLGPQRGGFPAHRNAADHGRRTRSLVARIDGQRLRRMPRRAAGRRASAVSAVHIRHHRKTQGHPAHHRRLFGGDLHHHEMGLRSEGRRHLLVYRRYRLGDRPQLHRLRPAAERRDQPDVRRRAQFSRAGPLLEHHRPAQGERLLHRPHGHPRLHAVRQ